MTARKSSAVVRSDEARPYGRADLEASMTMIGMGTAGVAHLFGVTPRSVQLWLAGERPVPVIVRRVMRGMALGLISREALERL